MYNKLVRDKIPQVIKDEKRKPVFYVAAEAEFKPLILNKLIEEFEEFKATPNEEELADLLEVIEGIASAFHLDMKQVRLLQAEKKAQRGGFEGRIVLEKVIE